jgi:hypothetical protein
MTQKSSMNEGLDNVRRNGASRELELELARSYPRARAASFANGTYGGSKSRPVTLIEWPFPAIGPCDTRLFDAENHLLALRLGDLTLPAYVSTYVAATRATNGMVAIVSAANED